MNYSSRQQPKRNWLRKVDWILVLVISLLALTSVILISSAMGGGQYSANFSIRQIIYYIFGAIIAFLIMIISPKKIKNTYILYSIFCVLLIGLLILPETSITPIINGAKSWYSFGPISIQPSEFMKIILILALAKTISKHNQFTFNKSFQSDLMLFLKF